MNFNLEQKRAVKLKVDCILHKATNSNPVTWNPPSSQLYANKNRPSPKTQKLNISTIIPVTSSRVEIKFKLNYIKTHRVFSRNHPEEKSPPSKYSALTASKK